MKKTITNRMHIGIIVFVSLVSTSEKELVFTSDITTQRAGRK